MPRTGRLPRAASFVTNSFCGFEQSQQVIAWLEWVVPDGRAFGSKTAPVCFLDNLSKSSFVCSSTPCRRQSCSPSESSVSSSSSLSTHLLSSRLAAAQATLFGQEILMALNDTTTFEVEPPQPNHLRSSFPMARAQSLGLASLSSTRMHSWGYPTHNRHWVT